MTPGIVFILVQHLDELGASLAQELLKNQTKLEVVEISDRAILRGEVLFHSPAHCSIHLKDGIFRVEHARQRSEQFTAIDTLLRSIAADQAHSAVGVVL